QRRLGEVEAARLVFSAEPCECLGARGRIEVAQIVFVKRQRETAVDHLERTLQLFPKECCPEDGMAVEHALPSRAQRGRVERPGRRNSELLKIHSGASLLIQAMEQDAVLQGGQLVDVLNIVYRH